MFVCMCMCMATALSNNRNDKISTDSTINRTAALLILIALGMNFWARRRLLGKSLGKERRI